MRKMRMRSAKLRGRGCVQCNLCTRRFQNASALESHRAIAHRIAARSIKKTTKPNIKLAPKTTHGLKSLRIVTKDILKTKTADKKSEIQPVVKYASKSDSIAFEEKVSPPKTAAEYQMEAKETKVQFECPECQKLFPVYFSASRHINKFHSIKNVGDTVSPSSRELIKPVRIEMCSMCKSTVRSTENHYCSKQMVNNQFECLGCDQVFNTISLYDFHVKSLHYEDVESLFFPNYDAFINWKNDVEDQTKIKFLKMSKRYHVYYYRCSQLVAPEDSDSGRARLCPATIVTQEFSKGIQAHFYKKHYKHDCKYYVLPDSMKCHSITALMKNVTNYKDVTSTQADEKDMYVQFKTLMESVVVNAAKLKMDVLNILMEKALEMSSVLTNYNEEDSDQHHPEDLNATASNKSLTDDQISKALEGLKSTQRKRKNTDAEATITPVRVTPKIINTFSLNEEVDILKNALTKDISKSSSDDEKKPAVLQSPSFNDSYKEFVDKQITKPPVTRSNKKDEKRIKTNTITDVINETTAPNNQNATNKSVEIDDNITAEPLFVDVKQTTVPQANNQQNRSPLVGQKVIKVAASEKTKPISIIGPANVKTAPLTDSNQKATKKIVSKPIESNLKIVSKPIEGNLKIVSKPIESNLKIVSKPIESNLKIVSKPIEGNLKIVSKPIERNLKIVSKPIERNLNTVSKPVERNLNTVSKPIERNRTPMASQKATPKTKIPYEKPTPVVVSSNSNKKRAIIRTKLGQFSPKRQITVSPKVTSPFANIKIEKYEVKERDNDCNILILKI